MFVCLETTVEPEHKSWPVRSVLPNKTAVKETKKKKKKTDPGPRHVCSRTGSGAETPGPCWSPRTGRRHRGLGCCSDAGDLGTTGGRACRGGRRRAGDQRWSRRLSPRVSRRPETKKSPLWARRVSMAPPAGTGNHGPRTRRVTRNQAETPGGGDAAHPEPRRGAERVPSPAAPRHSIFRNHRSESQARSKCTGGLCGPIPVPSTRDGV